MIAGVLVLLTIYSLKQQPSEPTYQRIINLVVAVAIGNQGKNNEAIGFYDKALAIDPNDVTALTNKGGALANLGKNNESLAFTDNALAINPNDVIALDNKGTALDSLGRYNQAIRVYDNALAIDLKNGIALKGKKADLNALRFLNSPNLTGTSSNEFLTYTNVENGFALEYPSNWVIGNPGNDTAALVLSVGTYTTGTPQISVNVPRLSGNFTCIMPIL